MQEETSSGEQEQHGSRIILKQDWSMEQHGSSREEAVRCRGKTQEAQEVYFERGSIRKFWK
jgi:hypothetical protein